MDTLIIVIILLVIALLIAYPFYRKWRNSIRERLILADKAQELLDNPPLAVKNETQAVLPDDCTFWNEGVQECLDRLT